jgi:DNA-binding response OmpR family regulator
MPKTILVVDDEKAFRDLLQEFLQAAGFEILLAENRAQAGDVLRAHPEPVNVILLDGTPYASRRETLVELQGLRPGVPVVVMSGRPWEELRPQFEGLSVAGYLPKPSSLHEILEIIEPLVRRSPGAFPPRAGGLPRTA